MSLFADSLNLSIDQNAGIQQLWIDLTPPSFDTSVDKWAYVFTTEEIPWAGCKPVGDTKNNVETRKFKCPVPEASSAIKSVISTMIQYVVFIATLCGVLMLAVWGIMYSIGGATDEGKVKAKKFIVSSIAGLILLFFVSAILYLVAPWVYS